MSNGLRGSGDASISLGRLGFAVFFLATYALPLFFPPGPAPLGVVTPPDASFFERILPGVPPLWIAIRLVALAAGVILLLPLRVPLLRIDSRNRPTGNDRDGIHWLRIVAVAGAVLQAMVAPWAGDLPSAGQSAYLVSLFVPALLLAWPNLRKVGWGGTSWRGTLPIAVAIALWTVLRLVTDLNSPRAAVVVDNWRGWIDLLVFVQQGKNLLTDLYDPNAPGIGATVLFFQGLPLYQSGALSLSFRSVQIFQILWLAVCAAGLGTLAGRLMGREAALVAVAVFLFSPLTRLISIFPMIFMLGPMYATAIALCSVALWRRRSEAALAALGALTGVAMTFPPVIPAVALFDLVTLWRLRKFWREVWPGGLAAAASFLAAVIPALPNVLRLDRVADVHFRWDGVIQLIDACLLGQLPIQSFSQFRDDIVSRPLDIVVGGLLAPFANPRIAVHLMGDVLFDPLGAVLLAIGIAACACGVRHSFTARVLLLFFLATLAPAFMSPVNVVDIVHAVALPAPAALLAAAGFAAFRRRIEWLRSPPAGFATSLAICVGGTVLFDVVNCRTLPSSSLGIMFSSLNPADADRVVVVDYPKSFRRDVRTGFSTGPITAFGGRRPVGYIEYEPGHLPVSGLAAAGKDLLFWSVGEEKDLALASAVCAEWPGATLYEIFDAAHVGRTYAANLAGVRWGPALPADRWRRWSCASRGFAP